MKHIKYFNELFENTTSATNPYIYDDSEFVGMIEQAIESEGNSFICTYVASAIKMLEGDTIKVYGFSAYKNPESVYFSDEGDDGHDFAVLNDRYIIDPWLYNNYVDYTTKKTFNRSVFDLYNKNDDEIIKYVYGNKLNWTDITNKIDNFKDICPNTYKNLIEYYNKLI